MALLSGVRHPMTNLARRSRNKRRTQSRLSECRGETESEDPSSKILTVQKGKLRLRGSWKSCEKTLEQLDGMYIFHLLF